MIQVKLVSIREANSKVTHVPIGTTQQMKMSCATFKVTTENPQWPPSNGAGRRTGGFLPRIGIFIRAHGQRAKGKETS